LELLGYEFGELVGKTIASLSIWACPERRAEFVQTLTHEGRIENFETRFLRKGGAKEQRIDVLISAATVEVNGTEMLLSTIRDITQRRDAERNLEQSRRRLRDLQRLAGLGTWSYNPETKVIQWSEETFRLTGRDPSLGEPEFVQFLDLIHPDDRPQFSEVLNQALENGTSYQIHFRQRGDDGDYRSLKTRGRPVLDDRGRTIEIYGILLEEALHFDCL
jgi:PAS domain S-box-containing protein